MKRIISIVALVLAANSLMAQFCNPTYSSSCTSNDFINTFTAFGQQGLNISNPNTGCNGFSPNNTTVFPFTVAGFPGDTINITTQSGTVFSQAMRIWVDWNNDQLLSPGESVWSSTAPTFALQTGSFIIPANANVGFLKLRILCYWLSVPPAGAACGSSSYGECEDYTLQVLSNVPCAGQPTAGMINGPDTVNLCPSASYLMSTSGTSQVSGLTYIWQSQTPPGTGPWTTITGATAPWYTVPAGQPAANYRMLVLCNNSFQLDTTDAVTVNTSLPKKALAPYAQSFENWINYCDNSDVPDDSSWTSSPFTNSLAWRRQDQGATANWANITGGQYSPPASHLASSARIHTYGSQGSGALNLHIDLSTYAGTKTLNFDYISSTTSTQPSLEVLLSTDGGNTFTSLATYSADIVWTPKSLPLTTDSSNCVIRFRGSATSAFFGDIGLDNVTVLQPCAGLPNAGIIVDTTACPNVSFTLQLANNGLAGGLSYQWQSAPATAGPWTTFATGTQPFTLASQPAVTFYRCIITCTNSGLSNMTPVTKVEMNDFYYCYCKTAQPNPGSFDYIDLGNVFISKNTGATIDTIIWNAPMGPGDTFNNAAATGGYTSYQFSTPINKIMRDSVYKARSVVMTQFTWAPVPDTRIFIDYNRDGVFQGNEIAATGPNSATFQGISNYFSGQFTVPSWALPGITGLRVITSFNSPINACDPFWSGEAEDYLVEIVLPVCDSNSLNAGTAWISDTVTCPGYDIVLIDTTHTLLNTYTGLGLNWERSTNGGASWTTIPGATSDTLIVTPNVNTLYRFRMSCNGTIFKYSNINSVTMINSSSCYPASGALWGSLDTADNGAFGIGSVLFTVGGGGPHVGNPAATRSRTDLSSNPAFHINLWTDSTYQLSFYNILKPINHGDAKITMFIDYNNDGQYNMPQERVFSGLSTANNFVTLGSFVTPDGSSPLNPITGTPTGLRVVLNNNTAPNAASDNGVGLYTSGETEDYFVVFRKTPVFPTGIAEPLNFSNVAVYPNPTDGMVFVDVAASQLAFLNVVVTSVAGQEVFRAQHKDVNGKFSTSLDLSSLASGTYMLKIQSDKGSVIRNIVLR